MEVLKGVTGAALLVAAAYSPPARQWYLNHGATPEEAAATLPGDELLAEPSLQTTRAITVEAAPESVWPWLVQMGSGRGGAYTYDWIENLFGLNMHSANEILPEFQDLAAGDLLPMGEGAPPMRVEICDAARTLAFRSTDGNWMWSFNLRRHYLCTRLLSRNRILLRDASRIQRLGFRAVMEPGSLIMERRMLLGIKRRAESPVTVR
ncbi:SRPBCC family protein [Actinoplanes sp. NPDC051861]|uniref:SRPBCC family protein n=1 Tax=Actinoplanes sp. NPDC051861 TaxID=3155170 RepID=UPI00344935F6